MTNLARLGPVGLKAAPCVSRAIRQAARGETCTLRLPGCDGGGETTVFCHIRRFGNAGVAQKPSDLHGVFGCANCHRMMDSRDPDAQCGDDDILRSLMETQRRLWARGLIRVPA